LERDLRFENLRTLAIGGARLGTANPRARNSILLIFERTLRLVLATGLGIYAARVFGPLEFGILSYAQSLLVPMTALANLGLSEVAIREMAQRPHERAGLVLAAFASRFAGAVLAVALAVGIAAGAEGSGDSTVTIVLIIVSVLLFQAGEAFEWRLIAYERISVVVTIRVVASTVTSGLKLWLLWTRPDLTLFAVLVTFEFAFACAMQLFVAREVFHNIDWRDLIGKARSLVVTCVPMLLRTFVVAVYIRIDQLSVAWVLGKAELGIYAVAFRLVEVWFILPAAVILVFAPRLAVLFAEDQPAFERQMCRLLRFGAFAAALFAIVLAIAGPPLVHLLLGAAYSKSDDVIVIIGFATIFGTVGAISNQWFVNTGRLSAALGQAVVSLGVSVVLYALLVPLYGAVGAAIAFCISQFVICILIVQVWPSTRALAAMQRRALLGWKS
jgi:O-antigen/teichoic acid export membrane protein